MGNEETETEREQQYQNEEIDLDLGRRETEAAISDASARSSRRRNAERAQRRAQKADKGRRREEDYSDTFRRPGRNGSTRAKDRYHSRRVTESDTDIGTGTDESSQSRWKMNIGKASRKKEREEWHRSKSPEGHYRKDRGPDLKIACPIFNGKKHDDPDVHIQAFEHYAELKHILEEEWGDYSPHILKEAARKWHYHYPASKLQSYKKLKKDFILEYTDDRGDEDIQVRALCNSVSRTGEASSSRSKVTRTSTRKSSNKEYCGTCGNVLPVDSSDNSSSSGNEQDEIEVKMCQRIEQLTIELEDLRQSLPAVAKFIKKNKQSEAMKVDTPQIKDDEVPVIQLDYKNRKQWEPLTSVVLDGGAGVNIIGEHMKEKMGITNIKPAPFRIRMADQRIVQPSGLLENLHIKVRSKKFKTSFLILDVLRAYSMLLGRPRLRSSGAIQDYANQTLTIQGPLKRIQFKTDNTRKWKSTLRLEELCKKYGNKKIEKMLASLNILPVAKIDLTTVLLDKQKAEEQRQQFSENFLQSNVGERPGSLNGLTEAYGKAENLNDTGQEELPKLTGSSSTSSTNDMPNDTGSTEESKQKKSSSSSSTANGEEELPKDRIYDEESSSEEVDSTYAAETRTDKEAEAVAKRKSGMPNWLLPEDKKLEEWNLGSEENPKMIKINKLLKKELKDKAWNLFMKFKDVFAWEHSDFKGVGPEVKCTLCEEAIDRELLTLHQNEKCPQRMMACSFCDFPVAAIDLDAHADQCGNRTEMCIPCKKYIRLRERIAHDLHYHNGNENEIGTSSRTHPPPHPQRDQGHGMASKSKLLVTVAITGIAIIIGTFVLQKRSST
ncbi:hypothetical protein L7F22_033875 [Adiantum nelumboides]|nr:hypothetical protein [Adiantum nelumboides]